MAMGVLLKHGDGGLPHFSAAGRNDKHIFLYYLGNRETINRLKAIGILIPLHAQSIVQINPFHGPAPPARTHRTHRSRREILPRAAGRAPRQCATARPPLRARST
ncbi:hypothetical protein EVAR_18252_1 [Eumeta japonica]|uniref:Uncharacterized protein n=1 Tax=Eumeta variegata TaxID=151549 RepID=A0A4C1UJL7_EUMVA|nr:hypothetical protein EVAR_18252_1 [Eumeta japonica]